MEDQNCFPRSITTNAWFRPVLGEEEFLYSGCGVDVYGTRDMAAIIFVLEAAINHIKLGDLRGVCAVQQAIQL